MERVTVTAPAGTLRTAVQLPRSKSAANRALIIAALLNDLDLVHDPGTGDDTTILLRHLRERPAVMHCGAGATTFRFLLAWACGQEGEERLISGSERLLQRPHDDLAAALRALGARVDRHADGFRVRGARLRGGEVHFDSPISSQYLSALLLLAPTMEQGLTLRWTGTRLSEPYVHMTLKIMAHFGVFPFLELDGVRVPPAPYRPAAYTVPPDWSAASFWYELVALAPGAGVLLEGLEDDTLQGDRHAATLWAPFVDTSFTASGAVLTHRPTPLPWPAGPLSLRHHPDLFQPLAATLAGRGVEGLFTGLDNLRVKETDRPMAMAHALRSLGCTVHATDGTFHLAGQMGQPGHTVFDTHADHRMAMAIAPLALLHGPLTLAEPDVVNKSYPAFWDHLRSAGFKLVLHP